MSFERGQTSAAETGQMSAVETRQMYSILGVTLGGYSEGVLWRSIAVSLGADLPAEVKI